MWQRGYSTKEATLNKHSECKKKYLENKKICDWMSRKKEKKSCKSPSNTVASDMALIFLPIHGILNFLDLMSNLVATYSETKL